MRFSDYHLWPIMAIWGTPSWQKKFINTALLFISFIIMTNSVSADIKVNIGQQEPIHFPYGQINLAAIQTGQLHANLGAYDVTSLIAYDESGFSFQFGGAVGVGTYLLRISLTMPDGETYLLVEDSLTFVNRVRDAGIELRSNTSYRVDESEEEDFSHSVNRLTESALRLQARRLGEKTELYSSADLQHRTDDNTLSGEKLEIANFNIGFVRKTALGNIGLAIGNQTIEQQGLVFNGFNRRGISTQIQSNEGHYRVKTFLINSDPGISSKEDVILASDKNKQSAGATLDVEVFREQPGRLRISSGYIDGKSELRGIGFGFSSDFSLDTPTPIAYGGKTWHVSANSAWWNQSLILQAEQAQSNFDSDGFDIGEESKNDKASRYSVTLSGQGRLSSLLKPLHVNNWRLNWQQQTVGDNFFSLANLGLPGDLSTSQTALQLAWNRVQLTTEYTRTKNNIDDREGLPSQTTSQTQLSANYSPLNPNEYVLWRALGRPSFSFRLSKSQREQSREHALLAGYDLDDSTNEYQFSASFQKEKLNWSIQHALTRYTNHATALQSDGFTIFEPGPDTINRFTALGVNFSPTQNISLYPSLQWSNYDEHQSSTEQDSLNAGLNANVRMFRDKLSMNINYNQAEQTSKFSSSLPGQEFKSQQASAIVDWQVITSKGLNPGLKVSLRHTWSQQKVSLQQAQDNYQITLGMELYWTQGTL